MLNMGKIENIAMKIVQLICARSLQQQFFRSHLQEDNATHAELLFHSNVSDWGDWAGEIFCKDLEILKIKSRPSQLQGVQCLSNWMILYLAFGFGFVNRH